MLNVKIQMKAMVSVFYAIIIYFNLLKELGFDKAWNRPRAACFIACQFPADY